MAPDLALNEPDDAEAAGRASSLLALGQGTAVAALTADRDAVLAALAATPPGRDVVYPVAHNPLGDEPATLLDLIAHVTMWDEINYAVLAEALAGRAHWSLQPRWETRAAGTALNRGGIAAGRLLGPDLVVDRFLRVRDAMIAYVRDVPPVRWHAPLPFDHPAPEGTMAGLCGYVNAPESDRAGRFTYRHACVHLGGAAPVRA
jgi:hypothetical protein